MRIWFPTSLNQFYDWVKWNEIKEFKLKYSPPTWLELAALWEGPAMGLIDLIRSYTRHPESFLPQAFCICAQLDLETLLDGCRDDEDVEWKLSRQDLIVCLKGRNMIYRYSTKALLLPYSDSLGCPDCVQPLQSIRKACGTPALEVDPLWPPAYWLERLYSRAHTLSGKECALCRECEDDLLFLYFKCRRELWENLGNIFGIRGWEWFATD